MTQDSALSIINEWLAANPIRKRSGAIIPFPTYTAKDLIDWLNNDMTEAECLEVAKEISDCAIEDLNYAKSQEYQERIEEFDAFNREFWG